MLLSKKLLSVFLNQISKVSDQDLYNAIVDIGIEIESFSSNLKNEFTPISYQKLISCEISNDYFDEDTIFLLEPGSNRRDHWSVIVIAYELSAKLSLEMQNMELYTKTNFKQKEYDELGIMYSKSFHGCVNSKSPAWLKKIVESLGYNSINSLIDILNLTSNITGIASHFYDIEKLPSSEISLSSVQGKIEAINDKTYDVKISDVSVVDSNNNIISLAGVIGSKNTIVDINTKNLLLEIGNFNKTKVKETSMRTIRTKASVLSSFEFSQEQVAWAIHFIHSFVSKMCMWKETEQNSEETIKRVVNNNKTVIVDRDWINNIIGNNIELKEVILALTKSGMDAKNRGSTIEVKAPPWRSDINIPHDVIEEIIRFYGINNVEQIPPLFVANLPKLTTSIENFCEDYFTSQNISQVKTYNLTDPASNEFSIFNEQFQNIVISNPISESISTFRKSLLPQLISVIESNVKRDVNSLAIFELQNIYKSASNHKGFKLLSFACFGNAHEDLITRSKIPYTTWYLKNIINTFLSFFNNKIEFKAATSGKNILTNESFDIYIDGKLQGIVGKSKAKANNQPIYVAEMCVDSLKLKDIKYSKISLTPNVTRDYSIEMTSMQDTDKLIKSISMLNNVRQVSIFDYFKQEEKTCIAIRVKINQMNKTLTHDEIEITNKQINQIFREFGIRVR
jgi:phenylalanyl-tRNA synthetase beta chain